MTDGSFAREAEEERADLFRRSGALIDAEDDAGALRAARDRLLVDIARWQGRHVEPYARLLGGRSIDWSVAHPQELPAVPTDVFRYTRVAAHEPDRDRRRFLTSGTTSGRRGLHALRDLALYERAARAGGRRALFSDGQTPRIVSLVPSEDEAPESSLSFMVARFFEWFGSSDSAYAWHRGDLDLDALSRALDGSEATGRPVALLGTSFAFVAAVDGLGARRWRLPAGSRIMQTGGFKGRTREIEPREMLAMLSQSFGIPESSIVTEYGMTELSSQMYDLWVGCAHGSGEGARALRAPHWVRVSVVDPETLAPLERGGTGLLRIEDAANVDTAWAVQTSDRAYLVQEDAFVLLGRAAGAVPRGCSLAVEEALGTG